MRLRVFTTKRRADEYIQMVLDSTSNVKFRRSVYSLEQNGTKELVIWDDDTSIYKLRGMKFRMIILEERISIDLFREINLRLDSKYLV